MRVHGSVFSMSLRCRLVIISLSLLALSGSVLAETAEEERARYLMRASSLAQQLGDKAYTVKRLPDLNTVLRSIDARILEINRKAEIVSKKGQDMEALGDKLARQSETGMINFSDLNELLKGTGEITREASEIGAEGAKIGEAGARLGTEAALRGLQSSRLGIAGTEVVSYSAVGLPSSALAQYQLRNTETPGATLSLARMRAAYDSGQNELAYRYATELSAENALQEYIALTTRFQALPRTGLAAHLSARRKALALLQRIDPASQSDPQHWAWARECQDFWLRESARFEELEVQDLADEEMELWNGWSSSGNSQNFELDFALPELELVRSEALLGSGDTSGATSWLGRAEQHVVELRRRLTALSSQFQEEFPGLRVSDSPRFSLLEGEAARRKGQLSQAAGSSPESSFQTALAKFQAADAPLREIELLIDWPELSSQNNERLSRLSSTHQHQLGALVAQINKASQQQAAGQSELAVNTLRPVVQKIRERAVQFGVAPQEQHHYSRAFSLLARLEAQKGDAKEAMATLTEQKKLQTSSQLQTGEAAPLRAVQQQQVRLRALEQEQAAETTLPTTAPPPANSGSLIASNKQEFVTKARELRETHPEYATMLFVDPVEFSKLQARIPADTVVLQYFPAEDGTLYIFAVTPTDYAIRTVSVESKELSRLVRRYRSIVGRFPPPPISWNDDGSRGHEYAKIFYRLHELLLEPVEKEIASAKTVAIVPTGHLHYLPFAGLARKTETGPEFLIQRKRLVVLSKASDLALLQAHNSNSGQLIALGNPDGSLPGAAQEVEELKKVFPKSKVLLGAEATKARLKSESSGAGYLHLATHGTLNNRDPNASFITLAGSKESGRLHPPEIFDLKLSGTRLVTMSACSTALGNSNPGAEVTSLAEAFWVAGAPSVVATLWKVEDESTRELMAQFYGELKNGSSLAASLQKAQIHQLGTEYAHPAYWAPFILLGDWR